MKKALLIVAFAIVGYTMNAQTPKFGVTAGFLDASASVKIDGETDSDSQSGFYGGILLDFEASDNFHIQPEILYANVDGGEAIMVPIIGKIYMDENASFQVGPQFVFATNEAPDDFSSIEFDLIGGLAFDFSENIFGEARYSFQLNNLYTGDRDITVKGNYLTLGLGYKF